MSNISTNPVAVAKVEAFLRWVYEQGGRDVILEHLVRIGWSYEFAERGVLGWHLRNITQQGMYGAVEDVCKVVAFARKSRHDGVVIPTDAEIREVFQGASEEAFASLEEREPRDIHSEFC